MPNGTQAPATAEGLIQHTQNQALVPATRPTPVPQSGSQALSLAAMSVQDAWGFAKALADSKILPRQYQNEPGSVLWALEYGRGIGLDVITTIQSVHIIQGKATMSADLMASLCRRAGHRMRVSGDETNAKVVIFRADDPEFPFEVSWTMERAKQAQLTNKDTWKQYPAAMLRARAISECVRMACPEVLHGAIYTPEERGAAIDEDGMPVDVQVVQPVQQRATEPAPAARTVQYPSESQDEDVPDAEIVNEPSNGSNADATADEAPEPLEALMGKVRNSWNNSLGMKQNLLEGKRLGVLDVMVPSNTGPTKLGDLMQSRIDQLKAASQERNAA